MLYLQLSNIHLSDVLLLQVSSFNRDILFFVIANNVGELIDKFVCHLVNLAGLFLFFGLSEWIVEISDIDWDR